MARETPPTSAPFHTRYGFSRPAEDGVALRIEPYPEICDRGLLRPTIVASAIDLVASMLVREIAGLDATFTSDLSLRAPRRESPERIDVRGEVLRAGKRLITSGVHLEANGEPFAYGESTFTRIERIPRAGVESPSLDSLRVPDVIASNPLDRPLAEEVGIAQRRDDPGGVLLELRDALRNPEGILQVALVALLVETAALSLSDGTIEVESPSERASGSPFISEMDLRYLAAARSGPILGRAVWVGEPNDAMIRVELRDAGQDDRLTTSALVRFSNPIRD